VSDSITIRELTTHDEMRRCEEIQRSVWQMPDLEVVPMHTLIALNKQGGFVLGAETGGAIIGFLYGYAGWLKAGSDRVEVLGHRHFHASQMLGVLPGYQDKHVGRMLKLKQRELALAQGHRLANWTFDPLQGRNAHFNIGRLGCIVRHYIRNLYDELPGINAGLPTDRLDVEWWLASQHVENAISGAWKPSLDEWRRAGARHANPVHFRTSGLPVPTGFDFGGARRILVEIPRDFNAVKSVDMTLAAEWRMHIRHLLEDAFAQKYAIVGFYSEGQADTARSYYLLWREFDLSGLAGTHGS